MKKCEVIDLPREDEVSGNGVWNSYCGAGVAVLYFDGQDYTSLEYVPLREDTSILVTSPIQKLVRQAHKKKSLGHKALLGMCSCYEFCLPTELEFDKEPTARGIEYQIDMICGHNGFGLFQ